MSHSDYDPDSDFESYRLPLSLPPKFGLGHGRCFLVFEAIILLINVLLNHYTSPQRYISILKGKQALFKHRTRCQVLFGSTMVVASLTLIDGTHHILFQFGEFELSEFKRELKLACGMSVVLTNLIQWITGRKMDKITKFLENEAANPVAIRLERKLDEILARLACTTNVNVVNYNGSGSTINNTTYCYQ